MIRSALKITLVFISVLALSCSSSDNSEGTMPPTDDPTDNPDGSNLTYTDDIRPIIQSNCISCHGNPPTNNAPMSLTTYAQVSGAVESRNLLARINSTANPMPPEGRMPIATRNAIEAWINAGLPE